MKYYNSEKILHKNFVIICQGQDWGFFFEGGRAGEVSVLFLKETDFCKPNTKMADIQNAPSFWSQ